MRGTYCDIHGHSNTDFRYADWTICWRCQSKLLAQSAAIQRVRELHDWITSDGEKKWCMTCIVHEYSWGAEREPWPCPTLRALDGDV